MPHLDVFVHSYLLDEELESLDPDTYKQRLQQFKWIQDYTVRIEQEVSMELYNLSQIAGHLMDLIDVMGIHPADLSHVDIPDIHTIYKRLRDMRDAHEKRRLRFE